MSAGRPEGGLAAPVTEMNARKGQDMRAEHTGRLLRGIVLQQALWVGLAGMAIAGIVSALILWLAKLAYVPIALSPLIVGGCLGLVLMVAIASGLIALGQLSKADPAALLR